MKGNAAYAGSGKPRLDAFFNSFKRTIVKEEETSHRTAGGTADLENKSSYPMTLHTIGGKVDGKAFY